MSFQVGEVCREDPQSLVEFFTLKPLHPQGDWALNRLPREVVTAPRQTKFKEHLGHTLRHMVAFLGMSCGEPEVVL